MAGRKRAKRPSAVRVARVKSVITARPQLPSKQGTDDDDFFEVGPLWLQAPPFGETDPFKEAMGSTAAERKIRMVRQNTRALRLLARATSASKKR